MYLLRVYYWDLYVGYKSNPKAMASVKFVRKEKQVFEFFYLVIEYHTISRDVAFWYKYKLSKYQTNILSRYSDGVVPVCLRKKRVIVEFD